jgi:hypothetical protein
MKIEKAKTTLLIGHPKSSNTVPFVTGYQKIIPDVTILLTEINGSKSIIMEK